MHLRSKLGLKSRPEMPVLNGPFYPVPIHTPLHSKSNLSLCESWLSHDFFNSLMNFGEYSKDIRIYALICFFYEDHNPWHTPWHFLTQIKSQKGEGLKDCFLSSLFFDLKLFKVFIVNLDTFFAKKTLLEEKFFISFFYFFQQLILFYLTHRQIRRRPVNLLLQK